MVEDRNIEQNREEEKEIDLLELAIKIWKQRKRVMRWCIVGAVLGLIIAFSIPKEYKTEVMLAPEVNDAQSSGNLGALASMAGLSRSTAGMDAVYPELYPDIVHSVPFSLSLLDVPLTDKKGERKFTVAEYLKNDTRQPWWNYFIIIPRKIIGAIMSSDEEVVEADHKPNAFKLTKEEDLLVKNLNEAIVADVDTKTDVVTITVRMQDPMVSALLADTVVCRLQEYVTNYRTNKARQDLEYIQKLNNEAKEEYYAAQQKYADYLDSHQGIVMYSARTMRDRLENEATLAFNLFNSTSHQLQLAKAKVQENTPVYATITPATVPIKAASPRKLLILAGFIFMSFVACVAWIIFIDPIKLAHKKEEVEVVENDD